MKQSSKQNRKTMFRIGKVRGDLRGKIWYLTYHEYGKRLRPKIGPDKEQARQMAARINSQLESHTHSVFNFEPVQIDDLQTDGSTITNCIMVRWSGAKTVLGSRMT